MPERIGEAVLEIETDVKPLEAGLVDARTKTELWAKTMEGVMRAHGVKFGESLAQGVVSTSSMQAIEKALGNVERATAGIEKAESSVLSNRQQIDLKGEQLAKREEERQKRREAAVKSR